MNDDALATRIARIIVTARVSVPTWIMLYVNVLIAMIVANSTYFEGVSEVGSSAPLDSYIWPPLLVFSSLVTLHGLLMAYHRTVSWGAMFGFMSWVMALISGIATAEMPQTLVTVLVSIPMMIFYTFVHLKHSYIERLREEHA